MKYKELIYMLKEDGWYLYKSGNHSKYRHTIKPGQLTVPNHSGEVPTGTANRILKDAGLK